MDFLRFQSLIINKIPIYTCGQYSSRLDGTVVIEIEEQLTRKLVNNLKREYINHVIVYDDYTGNSPFFLNGPYYLEEKSELLILNKVSATKVSENKKDIII
ncbi:hypothetical protein [Halobacillus seohaensis]|uniref:Uncharacterized protein n=1 Tax=Halobacillus seohaensis TaxID=447421 RepID=A0ABW2EIJ6_9BACI